MQQEGKATRLHGKVALVSGGSRGIGRAIVTALATEGAEVAFTYQANSEAAEATKREVAGGGGISEAFKADAASETEIERVVRSAVDRWGRIDIAVSSAGIMYDNSIEETELEEWRRTLDVNLTGVFLLTKCVTPVMKAQKYGRIVNVSSQAAFTGSARHAHYAASKAGVLGFTYSAAKELAPSNITVNVVTPGRIHTDMLHSRSDNRMEEWLSQIPLGRLGEPGEVAAAVTFLCSDDASYINGANINVGGGQVMG